jgi:zinc transport system permease protein
MIDVFMEMFSYAFFVRAILVGGLVSLCAALLGVPLVLKRYAMLGDGLSHVGFGALAVAAAVNAAPLAVAIPVVVLAAFFLLRISENGKIKGDAAVALISASALAAGVLTLSFSKGANTDLNGYLFGSIWAIQQSDEALSVALAALVLTLFILFYHKIFAVTFDETFARASGVKAGAYNMLTAFLSAVTVALGMRMMGALLISSLIAFPALTAMRVCKTFRAATLCAAAVSLCAFFTGVFVSWLCEAPTGASVVLANLAFFLLFWLAKITFENIRRRS